MRATGSSNDSDLRGAGAADGPASGATFWTGCSSILESMGTGGTMGAAGGEDDMARSELEPEPELDRRSEETSEAVLGLVTTTIGRPMPRPGSGAMISLVVWKALRDGFVRWFAAAK